MNDDVMVSPAPVDPWPVRELTRLRTRAPAVCLRLWRRSRLRSDHRRGASGPGSRLPVEEPDAALVATGQALREAVLAANRGRHLATNYRVLMLRPPSITAEIWFGDLAACMRHAGIDCRVLPPGSVAAEVNRAFEQFQPNVFIAAETRDALEGLDLPFVQRYKRSRGCLRMFIPMWHSAAPGTLSTPAEDAWRRELRARGMSADVHFNLFEPEFHERFSRDPSGPAVEYLAVPQACNPFTDFPRAVPRSHDYFMATCMTDDRVEVSYRFLRPVLGRYRGLWAGPGWGFGLERIPPQDMPRHYAEARIALSPLVPIVHQYGAELTHRVYAAAACGAFQLTLRSSVAERYFSSEELIQATSPADFLRLFEHYLPRPEERNAVALAALRRVYAAHTCFHRVDHLVAHWDQWRRRGWF